VCAGVTYLLLGPLTALVTTVSVAAPDGVIAAVAGLALIGTFGAAGASALGDDDYREAAALTFVVAASGLTIVGVGAAFWALLAGGVFLAVMRLNASPSTRH
jgi:benzoate membrane transport protein